MAFATATRRAPDGASPFRLKRRITPQGLRPGDSWRAARDANPHANRSASCADFRHGYCDRNELRSDGGWRADSMGDGFGSGHANPASGVARRQDSRAQPWPRGRSDGANSCAIRGAQHADFRHDVGAENGFRNHGRRRGESVRRSDKGYRPRPLSGVDGRQIFRTRSAFGCSFERFVRRSSGARRWPFRCARCSLKRSKPISPSFARQRRASRFCARGVGRERQRPT